MNWTVLAKYKAWWQAPMNTAMNLWAPQKVVTHYTFKMIPTRGLTPWQMA